MRKCQNTQSFNAQKRPWPFRYTDASSVEVPGISGGDGIAAGMTPPVKAEDNWKERFLFEWQKQETEKLQSTIGSMELI